jgi:ATP-dependent Clp protease ATP-binding subunit ClpA
MAEFPISLDNLIAYVRSMHDSAGPLEHLTDAVQVAASVDEQSDALIGFFVDQARRAGAPWSEIGASMGVSKQAVQKRFVSRAEFDDVEPGAKLFSRFTERARHVVRFARIIAASESAQQTTAEHLTAALLSEPDAVAARVIHGAGVTDARLLEAFALKLPTGDTPAPPAGVVPFADRAKTSLREALMAALRLGHNYIGTEHILLGILRDDGDAARRLETLGLAIPEVEAAVIEELANLVKRTEAGGDL